MFDSVNTMINNKLVTFGVKLIVRYDRKTQGSLTVIKSTDRLLKGVSKLIKEERSCKSEINHRCPKTNVGKLIPDDSDT